MSWSRLLRLAYLETTFIQWLQWNFRIARYIFYSLGMKVFFCYLPSLRAGSSRGKNEAEEKRRRACMRRFEFLIGAFTFWGNCRLKFIRWHDDVNQLLSVFLENWAKWWPTELIKFAAASAKFQYISFEFEGRATQRGGLPARKKRHSSCHIHRKV